MEFPRVARAEYLGLEAVGWAAMTKTWWHKVLAGLIITAIVLGTGYISFLMFMKFRRYWQGRRKVLTVPTAITKYMNKLGATTDRLFAEKADIKTPKSFGTFLGSFSNPPTSNQVRILTQWDLVVLDPLQPGVLDAVLYCTSAQRVARLDVGAIVAAESSSGNTEIIRALGKIAQTLDSFKRPQDAQSSFTGVLLAEWQAHFPPAILGSLIKYINGLGLEVYLELSQPDFLTEDECREIGLALVSGIVCRNGTILPDGDRRNFFQMANMRRAFRAFAAQSAMSGSIVMMWETVDDNVVLDHAVVKRSFTWCSFNSAISWIGSTASLYDADIAGANTVHGEPLGAMMWLKEDEVLRTHDIWRLNNKITQEPSGDHTIYDSLNDFVPDLAEKLSTRPPRKEKRAASQVTLTDENENQSHTPRVATDPFSVSPRGNDYTSLGCFQLGMDCTSADFNDLVDTQSRLRDLKLLDLVKPEELHSIGENLKEIYENNKYLSSNSQVTQDIKKLIVLLMTNQGQDTEQLKVYVGLDSGFHNRLDSQFWGLYDIDTESNAMCIYLSAKAKDRTSTLLHTFLSSQGHSRTQCFQAELALSTLNCTLSEDWELPPRLVHDIEHLTPTETILFVQRLALSNSEECAIISARVKSCCEYQLLEVPSLQQLRCLNATTYLRGDITPEDLVESRLAWYREQNCQAPEISTAIALFSEIETRVQEILMAEESHLLAQLEIVLSTIMKKDQIDASADFFALSLICAFRKLAISEVYLEILDRNPLPNAHEDQAACFAEMFALGSRCENYFDMTPDVLGTILAARYRVYFKKYQPPMRDDSSTELPTAYASKLIDLDPNAARLEVGAGYQFSFLGIFALPALIDIMLLTTIGRGLYLTAYMAEVEKNMATTALMISLLLCGAFGTWISSGGSYYLHSMAFPAMNMYVLTRFVAGMAVLLIGGIISVLAIGFTKGFYAALIFIVYLVLLTMYLLILAALSIYQVPGFMFQSGRVIIMMCIPILFISPVITLWVGHDIIVYPCVLLVFLISLLFGLRRIMAQWATWYNRVPCVTDTDVVNWYTNTQLSGNSKAGLADGNVDLAATPLPRRALLAEVLKERNRPRWRKATTDELVLRLAEGYETTMFLMDWYCKYSRTNMPYPYSPTWNLQCKAGVETLKDTQKGLKLHNAFVHWRQASDEVWCGLLYFVIALLDKWVKLFSGGSILGLSDASSQTYRLAVGFGLAYYLVGALALDGVSQPLWALANKVTPQPILSLGFLRQAAINDTISKRQLYWRSLFKFFFVHVWGLSITAALMWTFENGMDAAIMYMAYIGAYTGLLWYQYNRIFTGPIAFKNLLVAAACGLTAGPVLIHLFPEFAFNSVIALAIGTWTAALLSLWSSKIGRTAFKEHSDEVVIRTDAVYYGGSTVVSRNPLSQTTLAELFQTTCEIPEEYRFRLTPSDHPGKEVMRLLISRGDNFEPEGVQLAFDSATRLVHQIAKYWQDGHTVVELVPTRHLLQKKQNLRSISKKVGDQLHIFVFIGLDFSAGLWTSDVRRNCQVTAEAIIQATLEAKHGFSHDQSTLAELLVVNDNGEGLFMPEGVMRQLETSSEERSRAIDSGDKALLSYLLLGLNCDKDWDLLPKNVRTFLLKRCYGESCYMSDEQFNWISSTFCTGNQSAVEEYVARCNLGVELTYTVASYAEALNTDHSFQDQGEPPESNYERCVAFPLPLTPDKSDRTILNLIRLAIVRVYNITRIWVKFLVISLVADPEYQRELDYMMSGKPWIVHWPVTFILNGIWNIAKVLQNIIVPYFMFYGRERILTLRSELKGMKTTIEKSRIVVQNATGLSTCFLKVQTDGSFELHQYSGSHAQEPAGKGALVAINTYTSDLTLQRRDEYAWEAVVNKFTYEYSPDVKVKALRLPMERHCPAGKLGGQIVQYDERGYITSGSILKEEGLVSFKFFYRENAKYEDELLRAEYVFPQVSIKISWATPPPHHKEKLDRWIPHSRVLETTFIRGGQTFHSTWNYDHKHHPIITTTLDGEVGDTPSMILDDWYEVLKKPQDRSFNLDNPLFGFKSVSSSLVSRFLRRNVRWQPISTSRARTHLWKTWKGGKDIDAVTVRWLDEHTMRSDAVLRPYWTARDIGRLQAAEKYLNSNTDTIMARTDIELQYSQWTLLAFKLSDLYSFGQGGDARINTRGQATQLGDTDKQLHVLAMDTGTWPMESGGVSACRRDMVNNLNSIKWHVLAESANDFGVPRFQIEENVQSLTVLPLWGLDFLTPTHGVFQSCLDSEVQERSHDTLEKDIRTRFLPILTTLVRCSRAIELDHTHLEEASKALVELNDYFQSSRHWSEVWTSETVKKAWQKLWLTEDMDNARPLSEWLDAERPTLLHLEQALDMWHRYLFIFSVPVPEEIPDVFQASHHFTGASYGVLCKIKRNCTLHVWDHCISWREVTVFLSSAMSFDPPFVCTSLMSISRLACTLILHHADVVLPCADFFNPGWEIELGTRQGTLEHRRTFARKIDPVVNGITDMERFKPIEKIKSKLPTVTMLSHVRFVKDIKTAVLAADIIVNEWGFSDYRLEIWGDMEKAPTYSVECQEIIASKSLRDNVSLKGLGNPTKVLEDAWIFLNSSVSEGLPLAMGEAALNGVPVVCTDVGASFRVVTDPVTNKRFSAVVAPNDAYSLAKAQINVLAMLDEWSEYADDEPGHRPKLPLHPTPQQAKDITKRMYEKTEQRRRLGMMGRNNVLSSFSSDRYLREHEQMLWIGKYQSQSYRDRTRQPLSSRSSWSFKETKAGAHVTTEPVDREESSWQSAAWPAREQNSLHSMGSRLVPSRDSEMTYHEKSNWLGDGRFRSAPRSLADDNGSLYGPSLYGPGGLTGGSSSPMLEIEMITPSSTPPPLLLPNPVLDRLRTTNNTDFPRSHLSSTFSTANTLQERDSIRSSTSTYLRPTRPN